MFPREGDACLTSTPWVGMYGIGYSMYMNLLTKIRYEEKKKKKGNHGMGYDLSN